MTPKLSDNSKPQTLQKWRNDDHVLLGASLPETTTHIQSLSGTCFGKGVDEPAFGAKDDDSPLPYDQSELCA